jgi:ureidoacrylate peracid hydrolase
MHRFDMPGWAIKQVCARRGRVHVFDRPDPRRTALLVIDMQNAFLMDSVAHSPIPLAREIVPNINCLADAVRQAGGLVVWITMAATEESLVSWSVCNDDLSTPERREKRYEAMREGSIGQELWAGLDVRDGDARIRKMRYSALIQGSSRLEALLRERGIDTLVVTGTVTGVCCESTARDAMMLNFKTIMVSDACAARTDTEHATALVSFYVTFGDVMTTDEVVAALQAAPEKAQPSQTGTKVTGQPLPLTGRRS